MQRKPWRPGDYSEHILERVKDEQIRRLMDELGLPEEKRLQFLCDLDALVQTAVDQAFNEDQDPQETGTLLT